MSASAFAVMAPSFFIKNKTQILLFENLGLSSRSA
jgi:hypothetical protein